MNLTQIKSKLDGLEGQMSGDADGRTGESQGTDDNGQPVKTPRELLPLHGLHTPKEEEELVQSVQDPENRQILVSDFYVLAYLQLDLLVKSYPL